MPRSPPISRPAPAPPCEVYFLKDFGVAEEFVLYLVTAAECPDAEPLDARFDCYSFDWEGSCGIFGSIVPLGGLRAPPLAPARAVSSS